MTSADIDKRIAEVISCKGLPFSESEFNYIYRKTISDLIKRGATKEQISSFLKAVDDAPIKGGRFNAYSGD